MSSSETFAPTRDFISKAHIKSAEQYRELYSQSVENPDEFWAGVAERLDWFKKWDEVVNFDFVSRMANPVRHESVGQDCPTYKFNVYDALAGFARIQPVIQ